MIDALDHINIRTARLEKMTAWYAEVLDLTLGPRPDFGFPGAWLYANGHAVVHLVATAHVPAGPDSDLRLEHAAFRASGFDAFIARLDARGEHYRISEVPGVPLVQVNVWDPDGNHLHIDFATGDGQKGGG